MNFRRMAVFAATFIPLSGAVAAAEEAATVQSLINQDFAIVGAVQVPAGGAGLFLQKKEQLFFCYATETPGSPTLTTRYCKPVQ
jgi:hypothetical protein